MAETTYKNTTRELEWFDLETRMRELLHEHLAPLISRGNSDREAHTELRKNHEEAVERIRHLETFVFGEKKGESIITELRNSISELESKRKSDRVSSEQEYSIMAEKVNSVAFQVSGFTEITKRLEDLHAQTTSDITSIHNLIENHQSIVVKEMDNLNDSFKQMNLTYTDLSVKTEEVAQRALNKGECNELTLSNFKVEIENFAKEIDNARADIRKIYAEKMDLDTFLTEKENINKEFEDLAGEIARVDTQILERDSFLDKYYPLRVVSFISDALHSCLDKLPARKFAEFENKLLAKLNTETLDNRVDTRDEAFAKIAEGMQQIEIRKADILSEKIENNLDSKSKKKREKPKPQTTEQPIIEPPRQEFVSVDISDTINDFINQNMIPQLKNFESKITAKLEASEKAAKYLNSETQIYSQELLGKLEDLERKMNKGNANSMLHITENKQNVEDQSKELKAFYEYMKNLALMVVCLVENAQIQQALETQDEKDRSKTASPNHTENFALNSMTTATVGIHKKYISCGNNKSMLSGLKTSVTYSASPLFYRNQKFKRLELISLTGRMLEGCWGKVSNNLPWDKAAFEGILMEAAQHAKDSEDNEKDPLPALPPSRRRTSHGPRRYKPF